ncbi:MAG TPA: Hsp20/alpha crystallin family protein [Spirochaetota bacterium]|nr:Hsp20/alpha crystallin family protein [Spirochaetota bacterium]
MAAEIKNTQRRLDDRERHVLVPPVDIYDAGEEYVLKAEMPGVEKQDLEITMNNNELEINAAVHGDDGADSALSYGEFRLFSYHRKFVVDDSVNSSAITAVLENGVLTLTLPKSEKVKPRKIEVMAG